MGIAIAVASGKGGTGKTSFCAGVGAALAYAEKKTLVIDADAGLRNADIVLGLADSAVLDFGDIIERGEAPENAIVVHPEVKGLSLLAAPATNAPLNRTAFTALVRKLTESYDYILIDSPAGLDFGFQMAALAADRAIIVVTPEAAAVRDAARAREELSRLGVEDVKLVVNRVRPSLMDFMKNIDDVMDETGLPLLGVVPEDEMVIVAGCKGLPLARTVKDGAVAAYRNIAARICGGTVPLLKLR